MSETPKSRDPRSRWDVPRSVRHLESILLWISVVGDDIEEPNSPTGLARQAGALDAVRHVTRQALDDYYKMVQEEIAEEKAAKNQPTL